MIGARHARDVVQPPHSDQVAVSETTPAPEARVAARHELSSLQELVARNTRTLMALINDGKDRRMARAAGELAVAVESMETATQKVLASIEAVDDCARVLVSALTDDYHHGLWRRTFRIMSCGVMKRAISRISPASASGKSSRLS